MRKRTKFWIAIIVVLITSIICVICSGLELKEYVAVKQNDKKLSEKVKNSEADIKNFNELHKINPDIVAWIHIPKTSIDYPVVMAKTDNNYYLNHDIYKQDSKYGAIFTDNRLYNKPFESPNCLIYGHNMGCLTNVMFGELMEYKNQKYYEKHKDVFIYTVEGLYVYRIISIQFVDNNSYVYNIYFDSGNTFQNWIKKSIRDTFIQCDYGGINLQAVDRVVTLSTCTYNKKKLILVCAKQI